MSNPILEYGAKLAQRFQASREAIAQDNAPSVTKAINNALAAKELQYPHYHTLMCDGCFAMHVSGSRSPIPPAVWRCGGCRDEG